MADLFRPVNRQRALDHLNTRERLYCFDRFTSVPDAVGAFLAGSPAPDSAQ